MAKNDPISFRPTNQQKRLLDLYQQEHGSPEDPMKKSEAASDILDAGLAAVYGGLADFFFLELAKYAAAIALTLTFVWWFTGVGQFYTYMFYGLALGSLAVHFSDFNPIAAVTSRLSKAEA